jgi:hypothetical protein
MKLTFSKPISKDNGMFHIHICPFKIEYSKGTKLAWWSITILNLTLNHLKEETK